VRGGGLNILCRILGHKWVEYEVEMPVFVSWDDMTQSHYRWNCPPVYQAVCERCGLCQTIIEVEEYE
jgi:hypothetical protein